jgi:hypothetical protein
MIRKTIQIFPVLFFPVCLIVFNVHLFAQPPQQLTGTYISNYSEEAVRQMVSYKIPASVILAQAIMESGSGTSALAKRSNNHFGIKCHREWSGDTVIKDDDEAGECFRSYPTVLESYTDHSLFLVTRPRYKQLFDLPLTDFRGWCRKLKECGYATYSRYADELIAIIEHEKLYMYDQFVPLTPQLPDAEPELIVPSRLPPRSLRFWCEARAFTLPEMPVSTEPVPLFVSGLAAGSQ